MNRRPLDYSAPDRHSQRRPIELRVILLVVAALLIAWEVALHVIHSAGWRILGE